MASDDDVIDVDVDEYRRQSRRSFHSLPTSQRVTVIISQCQSHRHGSTSAVKAGCQCRLKVVVMMS